MMNLFLNLKEAYETSTLNNNNFKKAIDLIKWDNIFTADNETYFVKGSFTLTVENLNPFAENWKPTAFFEDGSVISF